MRYSLLIILFFLSTSAFSQFQVDAEELCARLDDLVNEVVPESFEEISFETGSIAEVEDPKLYKIMNYAFLNMDYLYFVEDGESNKRLLSYPMVTSSKEEALQAFVMIKGAFDGCKLVYTSVRQEANPNIGMLAHYTIGIDKRFYNSTLKLYEYVSATESKYWIEYEMIAPKQK